MDQAFWIFRASIRVRYDWSQEEYHSCYNGLAETALMFMLVNISLRCMVTCQPQNHSYHITVVLFNLKDVLLYTHECLTIGRGIAGSLFPVLWCWTAEMMMCSACVLMCIILYLLFLRLLVSCVKWVPFSHSSSYSAFLFLLVFTYFTYIYFMYCYMFLLLQD